MNVDSINETIVVVLRYNKGKKELIMDSIPIESHFNSEMMKLTQLCDNPQTDLDDIATFLKTQSSLKVLNDYYKYW